jgi:hypothetical protein
MQWSEKTHDTVIHISGDRTPGWCAKLHLGVHTTGGCRTRVGQHFPYWPLDAAQLYHASCILSREAERHVTHTLWCTWRKSYFVSTALASITSVFITFMSIVDVRCSKRVSVATRLPCGTNHPRSIKTSYESSLSVRFRSIENCRKASSLVVLPSGRSPITIPAEATAQLLPHSNNCSNIFTIGVNLRLKYQPGDVVNAYHL